MNPLLTPAQRNRLRKLDKNRARRRHRASRLERLENRWVLDGAIAGTVFGDVDNDGQLDGGELGVEGRTVFLDINGNGINDQSTLTDGNGQYSFNAVPVGTHKVTQSLTGGVFQTGLLQPTTGNIFLDIPNRLDQAYDPIRGILYVTRRDNSGTVERYDVVNDVRLEPFHIGARAGAVAVTTNGKSLLVGEAMRGLTSFIVHKVDATNGQVLATMHYPQASLESGVFDIAVVNNTTALERLRLQAADGFHCTRSI